MFNNTHPLAGAVAQPLRIKYYLDGWNSFLFSEEVAGVSRYLLEEGLTVLPEYTELFSFDLLPERRARFVADCLYQITSLIVARQEDVLRASGIEVIDQNTATLRLSGWIRPDLFKDQAPEQFDAKGKTYFDVTTDGVVFCPTLNSQALTRQLERLLEETRAREPKDKYKYVIQYIQRDMRRLKQGQFHESQRYYTYLGKNIGEASRKGYLKCATDAGEKIVVEKAVDGDMQSRISSDACLDVADVFVLITNDGDHYPAAELAKNLGKTVMVVRHSGKPAKALQECLGDENIIRFYDHEHQNYGRYQFDFDTNWLRNQDERSLGMVDDMRRQYAWWEANGHVERPAFPPAPGKAKA